MSTSSFPGVAYFGSWNKHQPGGLFQYNPSLADKCVIRWYWIVRYLLHQCNDHWREALVATCAFARIGHDRYQFDYYDNTEDEVELVD